MSTSSSGQYSQLVFREPFDVSIEQLDIPEQLKGNEVLVKTIISLISPGTELALYTGTHVAISDPNNKFAKFPFSPGYSSVGEVVAVGDKITDFQPGDIVYTKGKHAAYNVVSWKPGGTVLFKLPQNVTPEQVVFARLAEICMSSVIQSRISFGDNVVVLGMGLIGNLASQLFAIQGAFPIGVDVFESRLDIARKSGISNVIRSSSDLDLAEEVGRRTGGRGADIVIEATGSPDLVNPALQLVRKRGQVVLLGSTRGNVDMNVYEMIHRKGIWVSGAHEGVKSMEGSPSGYTVTRYILHLMERGALKADALLTHTFPYAEAKEAYELLLNKKEDCLGVVLDWRNARQ